MLMYVTRTIKMSRPDRSEKLLNRKKMDETTVTMTLGSLMNPLNGDPLKILITQAIEKRLIECSVRTQNASIALNLMIRECFDGVESVSDVELPCFWDQTFLRQLHLGTEGAQEPNARITNFFQQNPKLKPIPDRSLGDRNIYSALAITMSTNVKNHLTTNFQSILQKYIYTVNMCTKDQGVLINSTLYGWKSKREFTNIDHIIANQLIQTL